MNKFHPPEVVGRASETELQMGWHCNNLTWRLKGYGIAVEQNQKTVTAHLLN